MQGTYEEKIVGAKCTQCDEGVYVKNPNTGKVFCDKKCWTSPGAPQSPKSHSNVPSGQFLTIAQFNETLDKMRAAFKLQDDRIKKLESLLANELGMVDELEIPIV